MSLTSLIVARMFEPVHEAVFEFISGCRRVPRAWIGRLFEFNDDDRVTVLTSANKVILGTGDPVGFDVPEAINRIRVTGAEVSPDDPCVSSRTKERRAKRRRPAQTSRKRRRRQSHFARPGTTPGPYEETSKNEAYAFLLREEYPDRLRNSPAGRKTFKGNITRRFQVDDEGCLRIRRRLDVKRTTAPSWARQIFVEQTEWRRVLTHGQAMEAIHDAHHTYSVHSGADRIEHMLRHVYIYQMRKKVLSQCGENCPTCTQYCAPPKKAPQTIVTSFAGEIVMFDCSHVDYKDEDGFCMFVLMTDHFTKWNWALELQQETSAPVAAWLVKIFKEMWTPARFHCDNGAQFINQAIDDALEQLGGPDFSHGLPRNPQCQGLVENRNKTFKRKITQSLTDALWEANPDYDFNKEETFDWRPHFRRTLNAENDAPIKAYGGLTPRMCMFGRPALQPMATPLGSQQMSEMHAFMHQQQQKGKMKKMTGLVAGAIPEDATVDMLTTRLAVGDEVRVFANKKTRQRIAKGAFVGGWTARARVREINRKSKDYYRVTWITRGVCGEKRGQPSKHNYHRLQIRTMAELNEEEKAELNEEEKDDGEILEGDGSDGGATSEQEQVSNEEDTLDIDASDHEVKEESDLFIVVMTTINSLRVLNPSTFLKVQGVDQSEHEETSMERV